MSADEVQAKFAALAARTLHDTKIRALSDMLLRLEMLPDAGELIDAVRLQ
jgi:hypothetical protein